MNPFEKFMRSKSAYGGHSWLRSQQLPESTGPDNEWRNVSLDRIRDELQGALGQVQVIHDKKTELKDEYLEVVAECQKLMDELNDTELALRRKVYDLRVKFCSACDALGLARAVDQKTGDVIVMAPSDLGQVDSLPTAVLSTESPKLDVVIRDPLGGDEIPPARSSSG